MEKKKIIIPNHGALPEVIVDTKHTMRKANTIAAVTKSSFEEKFRQ